MAKKARKLARKFPVKERDVERHLGVHFIKPKPLVGADMIEAGRGTIPAHVLSWESSKT